MRVLHVTPYMHAAAGGPPVVVEQLCRHQTRLGWSASVVSTSQFCDDDGRELERELRHTIDATILPIDRSRLLGWSSKAESVLTAGVKAADIVHLHTLWHPLNGMVRNLSIAHGRPYVMMPHGMLDPYALGVRALRKRAYLALTESRTLRQAARLIFTSPLEDELARRQLPWLGAAAIIPLGADPPTGLDAVAAAEAFHVRFPETRQRRLLVHLGRIHQKKGLDRALAGLPGLIADHPDICLVLAGGGDETYLAELASLIRSSALGRHVLFTGLLQGDVKWGALAAAEVFLLPSHQENFAIAVGEAMHMARPVVISDKVNIHPLVATAGGGIVVASDAMPDALAAALRLILGDRASAQAMGERGQRLARDRFVWDTTARATIDCYGDVVGQLGTAAIMAGA